MAKKAKAKRRPGGRPALPPGVKYVIVSITLPPVQLAWIDAQVTRDTSRSAVIQALIHSAAMGTSHGR